MMLLLLFILVISVSSQQTVWNEWETSKSRVQRKEADDQNPSTPPPIFPPYRRRYSKATPQYPTISRPTSSHHRTRK
jgi:hypothetical protein